MPAPKQVGQPVPRARPPPLAAATRGTVEGFRVLAFRVLGFRVSGLAFRIVGFEGIEFRVLGFWA